MKLIIDSSTSTKGMIEEAQKKGLEVYVMVRGKWWQVDQETMGGIK